VISQPHPVTTKKCPECGLQKALEEFPRNRNYKHGRHTYCRPCHVEIGRRNRERRHGSVRNYLLGHRYGVDVAYVDHQVQRQGGVCAICAAESPKHLDHDHATGLPRGVLCFSCNGALGQFDDDLRVLSLAASYLETLRLFSAIDGMAVPGRCRVCLGCGQSEKHREFVIGRPIGTVAPFCSSCYDNPSAKPLVDRHYRLRRKYRFGLAEFERLVEPQGGRCAICFVRDAAHVDHDHVRGIVRGILCGRCNTGMGQLKDDPSVVKSAIAYLKRWQAPPDAVHEPPASYILSVA